MTSIPTAGPTVTLPQELTEFLLELALALQRFAMYPGGHPSVDAAIARLAASLGQLLRGREMISLGVARRQLVIEGVATESTHPVLRALAERLHRHRLGAVVLRRGVEPGELTSALRAVAADPERTGEPLGAAAAELLEAWPHVRFYRVTYEQLQLAEEEPDADDPEEATQARSAAASQLWMGLARAAVETGEAGPADDAAAENADPAVVAHAINEHPAAQAYDQMIVGFMLQLAEELRADGGAGTNVVRRRMSQMIRNLDPATLQRLLNMGGDRAQRARFLNDAADGLRPDAVIDVVRAAAQTQGENISTSMLRLLRKLSTVAEQDASGLSERAEQQMREQVRAMLEGWTLEDPNPDAYTRALESMSATGADEMEGGISIYRAEPLRLLQMGIEVGATGAAFWRAVDALVDNGGLAELFAIVDGVEPGNEAVDALWRWLEAADHIRRILTTDPVDFASLDRIFERMPAAAVISLLLDRLSESTSRATRMGVFRRVSSRGFAAVPPVMERLRDGRWFVIRNMLALLNEIGSWPASFSPLQYARHGQVTVRREALQLATQVRSEREQAICLALADTDERVMRIGVNAARAHGLPRQALAAVLQRLDEDALSPELRASLIRLLSPYPTAPVVEQLARFVVQERRLLGRPKLAPKTPELLAAVAVLAGMTKTDARARQALELARTAPDTEIRAAAGAS